MPKRTYTDEILTVRQVAEEWQVSLRTVQRYVSSGRLQAIRLPGGQVRINRSAVNAAAVSAQKV